MQVQFNDGRLTAARGRNPVSADSPKSLSEIKANIRADLEAAVAQPPPEVVVEVPEEFSTPDPMREVPPANDGGMQAEPAIAERAIPEPLVPEPMVPEPVIPEPVNEAYAPIEEVALGDCEKLGVSEETLVRALVYLAYDGPKDKFAEAVECDQETAEELISWYRRLSGISQAKRPKGWPIVLATN